MKKTIYQELMLAKTESKVRRLEKRIKHLTLNEYRKKFNNCSTEELLQRAMIEKQVGVFGKTWGSKIVKEVLQKRNIRV